MTEQALLTPRQVSMARHALGLDVAQHSYRNRYFISTGRSDYAEWVELANRGLASWEVVGAVWDLTEPGLLHRYCFSVTERAARSLLLPGESLDLGDFTT